MTKVHILPTAEAFRTEKPTSQSRLRRASSPFRGAKERPPDNGMLSAYGSVIQ